MAAVVAHAWDVAVEAAPRVVAEAPPCGGVAGAVAVAGAGAAPVGGGGGEAPPHLHLKGGEEVLEGAQEVLHLPEGLLLHHLLLPSDLQNSHHGSK